MESLWFHDTRYYCGYLSAAISFDLSSYSKPSITQPSKGNFFNSRDFSNVHPRGFCLDFGTTETSWEKKTFHIASASSTRQAGSFADKVTEGMDRLRTRPLGDGRWLIMVLSVYVHQ